MYIYIQSASEDSGYGLFTYRIYEEYHINLCECLMYGYCYKSFSFQVYITKLTSRAYTVYLEGNSNLVKICIINLFHWRISLYSPSHQMTVHVKLEVEKQQI